MQVCIFACVYACMSVYMLEHACHSMCVKVKRQFWNKFFLSTMWIQGTELRSADMAARALSLKHITHLVFNILSSG